MPVLAMSLFALTGCNQQKAPSLELIDSRKVAKPWSPGDLTVELDVGKQPVLVEIRGEDVHFRSRLIDPEENVISEIELPFLRSAPVFHFVDAQQGSSLELQIAPKQSTRIAAFTVNHYTLPSRTTADQELMEAWRDFTNGIQFVEGEDETDWASNLRALDRAVESFNDLGAKDAELWAHYFGAYFRYFPLYRYQDALEEAESLLSDAQHARLSNLEMLSHQLIGQILIEQDPDIYGPQRDIYAEAHQHFEQALRLAQQSNNGFEAVWSFNNLGITAQYQGDPDQSLDEYGKALDLAIQLEDSYLVSLIGMNMAVSQESLGRINQAIETLHRIESELVVGGAPAELEHLWSLLGGYYLKRYEFPEALATVDRALALSEELGIAESLGRNQLLLAHIYRELGQSEKSLKNIGLAIPNLEASRSGRGLRRAYALAADLHRESQQFSEMQDARLKQEQYLRTESDRARWIWGAAQDALARGEADEARELFAKSTVSFDLTPFRYLGQLASLQACALVSETSDSDSCNTNRLAQGSRELLSHEASSYQLEGRYLMAKLLAGEGQIDAARETMDALIDDLSYYRHALPGVLGAWYWDARSEVFDFHLELALQSGIDAEETAYTSLSAVNRLRNLGLQAATDKSASITPGLAEGRSTELRQLLAQRDDADSEAELEKAERDIDLLLVDGRRGKDETLKPGSVSNLRQNIASLPDDWSLLTFHLADDQALAWTGTNEGLRLHKLGRGDELKRLLKSVREEIRTINSTELTPLLEALGAHMFAPIARSVKANILLVPAGALSDFPFEALIVNDQYLIENYRVQNAMSPEDLDGTIRNLERPIQPKRLFLAGNPDLSDSSVAMLPGSRSELTIVAQSFPEATNTLHAQQDLQREVFRNSEFTNADLIHIASHATVDTVYPELSRIELSGDFLTPADLDGQQVAAELVVLSACSTVGLNRFEYDSHLGFVSEFLAAGANGVLASLWPVPDRRTAEFFEYFYSDLVKGGEAAAALRRTKLNMIDAGQAGVDLWVAIQLYGR